MILERCLYFDAGNSFRPPSIAFAIFLRQLRYETIVVIVMNVKENVKEISCTYSIWQEVWVT